MKINVLLDSGAYSALHAGKPIDPKKYRAFVLQNRRHVHKVVALDVIPGTIVDGKPATPEEAPKLGYDNWRMLMDEGVDAMPVFHRGEEWRWLDRYVAEGAAWIGLSSSGSDLWLDAVFTKYAGVKFHGFKETRLPVLLAHPWHSVDSRTAVDCAKFGQAFVPTDDKDTLGLRFFGPEDTDYPQRHYRFLPSREQKRIRRIVESYRFSVEYLDEEANRAIYNAVVLNRIVLERATNSALRVFHAVSDPEQDPFGKRADIPDRADIPNRLISYAFVGKKFDLGRYVREGAGT